MSSFLGFPGGAVVKNLPAKAGDTGSISGLGRSPREGNGKPSPVFLPGKFHADDTTLMAESEEEPKSLLMKVKVESEKLA